MSEVPALEYLGSHERERRRAPRVVAAVVLAVAVAAAGFLWWADSVRADANAELAAAFAESSARATTGEGQVQGTLAYASPMIWSSAVPEHVRASLRALVEASAADVADDLSRIEERVSATTILPWHDTQENARAQVLALIDAQRSRFAGIANDASDIDIVLAGGPLPTGAALAALRASGAEPPADR
jgi:hypothetical protein